ncbi:MAG: deoxyribodipyrimidine photo-lyase, partial [Burkholderiaceae bacterium]|nr:deoxyribodipyrimidine photo-lyase [Burkholderiaceae bacterium]
MTALVWLRCDLRTRDNPALSAALENGPAIAVYDIAPAQWRAHDDSPAKVDFWLRNLRDLSDTLHAMGVPLKILNGEDWADTADRMLTFCRGHAVEQVHVNAEWGLNERRRDEQVAQRLNDAGIDWQVHHGATLLSPGSVLTGKGEPYKVFTPYARACRERLRTAHIAPARRSGTRQPSPCERDSIPNGVAGYD